MVNTITDVPFKANKDLLNIKPCGTLVMIANLATYFLTNLHTTLGQ
jgi:hypothetical protein